mmetsp:Transcript_19389/g.32414  ORF Transcript_19389/g.32414 Transcript_19389/m.32414 type:complete len:398 (-) Transcript_19389:568-1761(-)
MSSTKTRQLKKETEMRCEVAEGATLTLKLILGNAEIFGVEMAPNKEYSFSDQNIAVFTWYGCTIESSGDDSGLYEADTTPMVSYINTHIQLEARRDAALANKELGPRVMIVGPVDQGKSTLARLLTAYAVRLDRTPILVDIDPGQGSFAIPGCLTAVPLDKSALNVEEGFTNATPLVYFHGYTNPKDNVQLYKSLISAMASKLNERLRRDLDTLSSGLIVNTSGWIDGEEALDVLLFATKELNIDIVLVMSHDKLYSNLTSSLLAQQQQQSAKPNVTVVKLPRSGGIVARDSSTRKRLRKSKIREYFYGRLTIAQSQSLTTSTFSPERRENIPLNSFTFLRVGGIQLSEGMKVVGESSHQDAFKLAKITPTQELAYSVVAVLHNLDDWDQQQQQQQQ